MFRTTINRISLPAIVCLALLNSGCGSFFYTGEHPSVAYRTTHDHMPEEIRTSLQSIEVVANPAKPVLSIGGDYGQYVPTTGEGAKTGMAAGAQLTGEMIAEDPRSLLLAPFIFPVALVAGGVGGATTAKVQKELAEFREGLTDELLAEGSKPVPAEAFAKRISTLIEDNSTLTVHPRTADATLEITINEVAVNTKDEDAIIVTHAMATLRSSADGSVLYSEPYTYSERNKLRIWAEDSRATWEQYAVRARHFVAAEVVADMFETIHLRHVLRPAKTESFGGGWNDRFKGKTTTLSWELFLLGGDPYASAIDENDIRFDLRILDGNRIVYEAGSLSGTSHTVTDALPPCRTLKWSVRPVYRLDGHKRAGTWMQYRSGFDKFWNHDTSQQFPDTPEYWRDFAEVKTRCTS